MPILRVRAVYKAILVGADGVEREAPDPYYEVVADCRSRSEAHRIAHMQTTRAEVTHASDSWGMKSPLLTVEKPLQEKRLYWNEEKRSYLPEKPSA